MSDMVNFMRFAAKGGIEGSLNGKYPFNPYKKHCIVTGGSSGLGFAIAKILVQKGGYVTILARDQLRLDQAKSQLENYKKDWQKINAISVDVTDYIALSSALAQAERQAGCIVPCYIFANAGQSKPGLFVEQDIDELVEGMDLNYKGALNTVHAATKLMISRGETKGARIVLIGSTLSLFGCIGFSQYAPSKHALKALAECLRQELAPFGIQTHIFFVSTIDTPGLAEEIKTKPNISARIEGCGSIASPDERARCLIDGISLGQFSIVSDTPTNLFRTSSAGSSPRINILIDFIMGIFGLFVLPIWRLVTDWWVMKSPMKSNL